MNNSGWREVIDPDNPGEFLKTHTFVLSEGGNPYQEVTGAEKNKVAINPYLRMYDILGPILEELQDTENEEVQKVFDLIVRRILETDLISGCDLPKIKQMILRDQITREQIYGKEFADFFEKLAPQEQVSFLNAFSISFDNAREHLAGFIYLTQEIFKGSLIFREKQDPYKIYLFANAVMDLENQKKIEMMKQVFFPVFMKLYVAWESPFILTDLIELGNNESIIV